MIRYVLLMLLALLLGYALSQAGRSRLVSLGIAAASIAGGVLVLEPQISTDVANAMGVGRGADLILYLFVIMMFTAVFNLHLRLRSHHETLTEVVRDAALRSAREPRGDDR